MRRPAKIALAAMSIAALGIAGAAVFVYSGLYDISATNEHTPPVYWLLDTALRRSARARAEEDRTPDLARADVIENGFRHYQARCVQCHGAPGLAPEPAALGMTPVPAYLVSTAREWTAAEIYWVVKHGIKMTGMPAWKYRMTDEEIWQVVAFVKGCLPYLSAQQYRDVAARLAAAPLQERSTDAPAGSAQGDPGEGKRAMHQYACATCHVIPGITGANKSVGPPLAAIASRSYIAGVLPNTPENMLRWIMSPQAVSALTAMPNLGVTEKDARNMAAYLATLKK